MAKYKNIRSAAHNFAYAFLGNMNFVGTGRAHTMVPEEIFRQARALNARQVVIDFLAQTVSPDAVATTPVRESVGNYAKWLPKLLSSQNIEPSMVRHARLVMTFDFQNTKESQREQGIELPSLTSLIEFVDDRGKVHSAELDKWWRE